MVLATSIKLQAQELDIDSNNFSIEEENYANTLQEIEDSLLDQESEIIEPNVNIDSETNSIPYLLRRNQNQHKITVDPEVNINSIDIGKTVEGIKDKLKNKAISSILDELGIKNFITDLQEDISRISGDIYTTLDDYGIVIPRGRAGLPNIQEAKIVFNEEKLLNILGDIFGGQTGSTYNNKGKLAQDYLAQMSQEYSENSALSYEGQSKIDIKIETAIASSEESIVIADDSNGQDVSQNILRNISKQYALGQQIDAMAFADLQNAKIDRSLSLQMQSEILKEISGNNTREYRKDIARNGAAISSQGLVIIPGMEAKEE